MLNIEGTITYYNRVSIGHVIDRTIESWHAFDVRALIVISYISLLLQPLELSEASWLVTLKRADILSIFGSSSRRGSDFYREHWPFIMHNLVTLTGHSSALENASQAHHNFHTLNDRGLIYPHKSTVHRSSGGYRAGIDPYH